MRLLYPVYAALLTTLSVFILYGVRDVRKMFIPPPPGFTMVHGVLERKTRSRSDTWRRRLPEAPPISCCTECEKHL